MKARCYRSHRKSEDPHYLSLILKEDNDKAAVSRAHCSCKGGSGGHCNHVLALLCQLNDYSCLDIKDTLVTLLVRVVLNRGISPERFPSARYQ